MYTFYKLFLFSSSSDFVAHILNPGLQAGKDGIEAAYVVVIIIWFQYISRSFFHKIVNFIICKPSII